MECPICHQSLVEVEQGIGICSNRDCVSYDEIILDENAAAAELLPFAEVVPNDSED